MNPKLYTAARSLSGPESARVLAVGAATWILTARLGLDLLGASGLWREDENDPTRALALGLGFAVAERPGWSPFESFIPWNPG